MRKIFYLIRQISILRKVNKLDIWKTGFDSKKRPYIQLSSGIIFYGNYPRDKKINFYRLLKRSTKRKLGFEFYQIACDIAIRYYGRALKFGGPKKEKYYSVKEGDIVVEMGAYQGYYTVYLSKKVGKSGRIIAIEPIEDNIKLLEQNIQINNLTNVTIAPKGVWSEKGTKTFFRNRYDNQSGSIDIISNKQDEFDIQVDSLDNILREVGCKHVDFMIVQLNGAEYNALMGLEKIEPNNLAIAARYNKDDKPVSTLVAKLLKERNYKVFIDSSKYIFAEKG